MVMYISDNSQLNWLDRLLNIFLNISCNIYNLEQISLEDVIYTHDKLHMDMPYYSKKILELYYMDVCVYNLLCIIYVGKFLVSYLSLTILLHFISILFLITIISQFLFSFKFLIPSSVSLSQEFSISLIFLPISTSKQYP